MSKLLFKHPLNLFGMKCLFYLYISDHFPGYQWSFKYFFYCPISTFIRHYQRVFTSWAISVSLIFKYRDLLCHVSFLNIAFSRVSSCCHFDSWNTFSMFDPRFHCYWVVCLLCLMLLKFVVIFHSFCDIHIFSTFFFTETDTLEGSDC